MGLRYIKRIIPRQGLKKKIIVTYNYTDNGADLAVAIDRIFVVHFLLKILHAVGFLSLFQAEF
jgi:hypothetical protein